MSHLVYHWHKEQGYILNACLITTSPNRPQFCLLACLYNLVCRFSSKKKSFGVLWIIYLRPYKHNSENWRSLFKVVFLCLKIASVICIHLNMCPTILHFITAFLDCYCISPVCWLSCLSLYFLNWGIRTEICVSTDLAFFSPEEAAELLLAGKNL